MKLQLLMVDARTKKGRCDPQAGNGRPLETKRDQTHRRRHMQAWGFLSLPRHGSCVLLHKRQLKACILLHTAVCTYRSLLYMMHVLNLLFLGGSVPAVSQAYHTTAVSACLPAHKKRKHIRDTRGSEFSKIKKRSTLGIYSGS